jgi:hypothetical protein
MDPQEVLRARLIAQYTSVTGGAAGVPRNPAAAVVVRDLDPAVFLAGTLAFARAVPAVVREPWRRAFTRTLFFAGNPASLASRVDFLHVAPDSSVGWLAPGAGAATLGRSLRMFRGPREWPGERDRFGLPVPGGIGRTGGGNGGGNGGRPGRTARLRVATARVSAAEYLIHVNHVLSEAVLRGVLRPGDRLDVSHTPHIDLAATEDGDEPDGEESGGERQLRIAQDPHRDGDLRLYAALTIERGSE